jgi:tripartite-type tricarboxylate transporter receptor subunit TctC
MLVQHWEGIIKLPRRQFLRLAASAAALPAVSRFGRAQVVSAQAQPVADFYRGKTINMVVGLGVGGESDLVARWVAKYLGRHIPGNPLVVVQNMSGAGGIRAANYLYTLAPQDGTSIGNVVNGMVAAQAVGLPGVQFNAANFHWMGSIAPLVGTIAVWHAAGIKTIEDARRREVFIASSGRGASTYTVPAMMNEYFGTKFKILTGYQSGNEQRLAIERGEVSGYYTTWSSLKSTAPEWIREKKIIIIAKEGPATTELDLPPMEELAKTAEDRKVVELILSSSAVGRPFAIAPGAPEARVAALRAAFDATMKDPDFLAEAGRLNYDVAPISGIALQGIVERVLSTPKELAALAKRLLE